MNAVKALLLQRISELPDEHFQNVARADVNLIEAEGTVSSDSFIVEVHHRLADGRGALSDERSQRIDRILHDHHAVFVELAK
jgi:hypothetical protein